MASKLRHLVFDAWTAFSHKEPVGEGDRRPAVFRLPSWVGPDNERRLAAYTVCRAYVDNAARAALRAFDIDDEEERSQHREFGDAALLVDTVADAVLGDEVQVAVRGADEAPPDEPIIPDRPTEPPADADEITKRVFAARLARWEDAAAAAIDQWEEHWSTYTAASERQTWLQRWAEDEQLLLALIEVEVENVCALGDGVYVVSWSSKAGRPVLDIYDPGFYFPVIDPRSRDRFPRKVHIAWEFTERDDQDHEHRFVHRITWELREVTARRYPWNDKDSTTACFMTEATWPLEGLDGKAVDEFSPNGAKYATNAEGTEIRDLDLGIDFIPVVHVPNTPSRQEHFGRSVLAFVAQLLDEIQAADTDRAKGARKAGWPVIAISGATSGTTTGAVATGNGHSASSTIDEVVTYGPGTVFRLGQGRMDVLDMSGALEALGKYVDSLLDRLSTNAQVPAEVIGRVKAEPNIAGITIALLFGPLRRLVRKLRLVRDDKYPLLLKFVQRLAQAGGTLDAGENPRAELVFGSFLPSDQQALVERIARLLEAHGISRLTTLRWMVAAGIEIGDLEEELRRIEAEEQEAAATVPRLRLPTPSGAGDQPPE